MRGASQAGIHRRHFSPLFYRIAIVSAVFTLGENVEVVDSIACA